MKKNLLIKIHLLTLFFVTPSIECAFKFSNPNATLAFDQTNSTLTINTSITGVDGRIKLRTTTGTTDGNVKSATGAETISFSGGSILQDANQIDLTGGTYDPKTGSTRDAISLGNGQIMSVGKGTMVYADVAVANGATATILGSPTFVSSVSLGNSSSVLNLAIQNKLNKDIVLNSGKLVLQDNLELADGVRIWGTGTVDINYQSLRFGTQVNSSVFSQDLIFWRAKDITLNGPVTLAGSWSFLTNSTDNESVINGNGNILTLNNGKLIVGDASAGHTLYISDLYIKGVSTTNSYSTVGLTKSQYAALSGLAGSTVTAGNSSYDAGFTAIGTGPSTLSNYNQIVVYDGSETASSTPYLCGISKGNVANRTAVSTDPTVSVMTGVSNVGHYDFDIGTDSRCLFFSPGFGGNVYISNGFFNANPNLVSLSAIAPNIYRTVTIGDSSNVYAVTNAGTQVDKWSGSGQSWSVFSSGLTNVVDIAASNDGVVWIVDNQAGTYKLYKQSAAGAIGTATQLTIPENPTTYTHVGQVRNAIAVKGSSSKLNALYCGASGQVYYSSNGISFTSLGNFGATGVAVGAQGTLAFTGPNDASTPGYANGLAIFVKPSGTSSLFTLYDGGATDANRGKVVLSNVTLELTANCIQSAGHITFKGDNCKIVTGGNKTINITTSNAPIEVDSVALTYDTLDGTNKSPFTGTAVTLTNGGTVRSASQPGETIIDANLYNGSSAPTLIQNYSLSQKNGGITVTNGTGAASQTVTINGGNYFWDFPGGMTAVLTIADKVTVTLTNVILKNFSLSNVSFGGASAALVFGDGCVIELGADQSLTTGQGAWLFSGNATIRGMGQTITLNNTDSIRQNMANKTLTISSTILKSLSSLSLGCASLGKIVLSNSTLQINTGGFTWSTGNLDISGYSKLASMNITTSGGSANFNLTTSGQMTVTSGSTLEFGRAINFAYSPTTTGDTGGITGTIAKRHFALGASGDASATLYANNCSIDSTAVGMALDRGNLVVENKVNWTASTTASYESEIGSSLNLEILSAAVLSLDGGIKYTVTTV